MHERNNHRRRLLDLTSQRSQQLAAADAALEANDQAAYNAAWSQVKDLDAQIQQVKDLIDAHEATPAAPPASVQNPASDASDALTQRRASNEYRSAFFDAIRAGATPRNAGERFGNRFGILLDALTEGGNNGQDGGFLVPVDLQTRINELSRQMVDLSALVNVEAVTAPTGFRVIDTKPTAGFTLVAEMAQIPKDDQPSFRRVSYSVKDYALRVPISNDLLRDNTAGLMEYLARWMARKSVITKNSIILGLLANLNATTANAGEEISKIKTALNVLLDPDIALNAVLLGNQTAYDLLDQMTDSMNRPLLQPDIAAGSGKLFDAHKIVVASNALLANDEESGAAPLYIGDLKQYLTIFDRQVMEFTTTDVGGDAWATNSTEGRAIMRLDAQVIDSAAAVALALTGEDADDGADGGEG